MKGLIAVILWSLGCRKKKKDQMGIYYLALWKWQERWLDEFFRR